MVNCKFATRDLKFAETLWLLFLCIFCCVIAIEKYLPLHFRDYMCVSKLWGFYFILFYCFLFLTWSLDLECLKETSVNIYFYTCLCVHMYIYLFSLLWNHFIVFFLVCFCYHILQMWVCSRNLLTRKLHLLFEVCNLSSTVTASIFCLLT